MPQDALVVAEGCENGHDTIIPGGTKSCKPVPNRYKSNEIINLPEDGIMSDFKKNVMKKNRSQHFFNILAVITGMALLVVSGCREQSSLLQVNPAFREYIQAFTTGIISTHSVIKVRLADDFADTATFNMPVAETFFRFKPALQGKTYWTDSRTIEFHPDGPLPQDRIFTVSFFLSKLITVPDSLKTLLFQVQTMKQEVAVSVENHKAYSHSDLSREFLTGILKTADVADDQQVEKVLKATQGGRDLPVCWSHDPKNRSHLFQVDSIYRGKTASDVKLQWDGSPIQSETEGELRVEIPALNDFKILNVLSYPAEQPCLRVQFSDPLDPSQDLDGLFRVGKLQNLRYSADDNLLWIYLPEMQEEKSKLTFEPSIKNVRGQELGKRILLDVQIENASPNLRFVGDGVILPSSNGMLLPFEAVNLSAVDIKVVRIFEKNILQFLQVNELSGNSELARVGRIVLKQSIPLNGVADRGRWNRFSIDLSSMIKAEPGAVYSVILSFTKEYSTFPCSGSDSVGPTGPDMMAFSDPDKENEKEWGYYSNYYDDDFNNGGWRNYRWEERNDPSKTSYYFNKTISRNVLSSDLGIIAKGGNDGEFHVYVTDIVSSKPLSGVTVEFFNFQLQSLCKSTTDKEGMATVPVKKHPFVLTAKSKGQTGYLKLLDGLAQSLSMFDVSGEPVQNGIKGYLYGERGVWRPGDSLFLTFILEDKEHRLPRLHPVGFSLFNPSGQLMHRMVRTSSMDGFYNFHTATAPDAPTGNWLAVVDVGGAEFRKTLKIETIKPNRLKITLDFKTDRLVKDHIPSAVLEATWLTGALAGNLKAKVTMTLTKSATEFKGYTGFVFNNPTAGFSAENITVFDGRLDPSGRALVLPKIHVTHTAPGVLNARFETMVFENGGDFSVDRFSLPYYPFQSYCGLRVPVSKETNHNLLTDQTYPIDLVNVDARGKRVPSNTLKVEVYKLEWRWWWDDSEAGSADFISTAYIRPVDSAILKTIEGKATYPFEVGYDDWGRYLVKVTDQSSGHAAGSIVYVDWPGYFRMPGGEKQAAAMLMLTTDKPGYKVGDVVKFTIPSAPDGRALVTIETGSKVLKSFWVPTSRGSVDFSFKATEAMAPNCYVYVTLVQPHAQTTNDLPIRLYGVVAVPVENPGTHLRPAIHVQKEWAPGQKVTIGVSERDGKPMTYTLAIVDEGLLDLTRFKTPDPWNVFYAREALGVKTWDLYDQVIGAYSGELQRILSIGGDQEGDLKGALKANRFVPMVRSFGPFELKKGQSRNHSFTMPQYIGAVRVMVIAGKDGAYGQNEKTVAVKKPLMVLSTLPRVVGPGETLKLPVSVFAMDKSIKNVKVDVEVNSLFIVEGAASKQLVFSATGDQMVTFDLKVSESTGIGRVGVVAYSGTQTAQHEIEIEVRNPNTRITNVFEKAIQPGASWVVDVVAPGIPGTNSGTLEISSIPPLNLNQRLGFLMKYPYGCLEQTVSAVFPQLYLTGIMDLPEKSEKESEQYIRQAIQRMKSFQLANGGLSYWPGGTYADDWGTSYAGHFMLEAEQKGYALPVHFFTSWKEFQRQKAVSWDVNAGYFNDDLVQAYRLFTLALARSPELGPMNRLLEKKDLSVAAQWQLAAAYQVAGKSETAIRLIGRATTGIKPYRELSGTFGSDLRDKAMIVEVLSLLNMRTKAAPLVKEISNALCSGEWYGTQSTAFALMAMVKFSGKSSGSGVHATYRISQDEPVTIGTSNPFVSRTMDVVPGKKGVVQVTNQGKNILFARVIISGVPGYDGVAAASNNLKMKISWKSVHGGAINPQKLPQGTNFIMEVTITNPGLRGNYQQLALSQVFPSGWEIINARSSSLAQTQTAASAFLYQDVRDDRVYTHFDLDAAQSKTFSVMLMAAYQGKFYLPAVLCEAMYDNTLNARVPGEWVEVVPSLK